MSHPSSQPKETLNESDAYRSHGQQPRRNSFTPSVRRERPQLRSSPLAGASYSTDGAGNVVEHTSALEEEIARRRSMLPGINTDDLARLAMLSPSTPALSYSSSPSPSRQGSIELNTEHQGPRRAHPSFISLAPQKSYESLAPPTPTSPTLRARHSSPHLGIEVKSSPPHATPASSAGPATANWMTAAPSPSFSRVAARGSGVILPVKASSRAGQQIRMRSNPSRPATSAVLSSAEPQSLPKPRSLNSLRSMSRLLRVNGATDNDKDALRVSDSRPSPGCQSGASSFRSGVSHEEVESRRHAPHSSDPATPNGPTSYEQRPVPAVAESSRFSEDADMEGTQVQLKLESEGRQNRVKRLWSKVRRWRGH